MVSDRAGAIVIVVLAGGRPDDALRRLIDQYCWVLDQRHLLERLYSSCGVVAGRPIRFVFLASTLTPAMLRRLTLLSFEVKAYLARHVTVHGEETLVVEPAAAIYGERFEPSLIEDDRVMTGGGESISGDRPDAAPDLLPVDPLSIKHADRIIPRRVRPVAYGGTDDPRDQPDQLHSLLPEIAEADTSSPAGRTAEVTNVIDEPDRAAPLSDALDLPDDLEPAGPFETLTAEEMEEFTRFDQMRRERNGETS